MSMLGTIRIWVGEIFGFAAPSDPSAVEGGAWTYETLILDAVRADSGASIAEILDRVVDEALRREQARGAWSADVGVWGPDLMRREVLSQFRAMLGTSLVLEGDTEGPWMVAPARPN